MDNLNNDQSCPQILFQLGYEKFSGVQFMMKMFGKGGHLTDTNELACKVNYY
jgi:hypothetical protein